MKVTFFLSHFPNYSETFIIQQIVSFIDNGIDVDIISIWPGDTEKKHEIVDRYKLLNRVRFLLPLESTKKINKMASRVFSAIVGSKRNTFYHSFNRHKYGRHSSNLLLPTIISRNCDVIKSDFFIAHFGTVGVIANKLRDLGLLNGKLATVFHGLDISHKKTLFDFKKDYDALFKESELILPISKLWANKLADMGCCKSKIHISRMGIDISRFQYKNRDNAVAKKQIVSVARLTEKKGLEYAIKACSALHAANIDFEYLILGTGPLKDSLSRLIVTLELESKVKLLGFVSQDKIKNILSESDIFLLPSVVADDGDMEGIPVALMEAMSVGLPVISTNHSGIPELIENGVSGWLAEEKNIEQLTTLLRNILTGSEENNRVTLSAREKIAKEFNQEKLNSELIQLLRRHI